MNEWGVAIAESSTTGRIVAPSDKGVYNSRPLFPIEELSRVALERCNTSRCAVRDPYNYSRFSVRFATESAPSDAAATGVPDGGAG